MTKSEEGGDVIPDRAGDGDLVGSGVKVNVAGGAEGGEDAGDADEVVLALEELVPGLPAGDPAQAGRGVDVEKDDEVGAEGEGLVHAADAPGVEVLGPLVGDGREVVAVEDDDLAGGQGRPEVLGHVLAPVLDEQGQLLLRRQGAGGAGMALDLAAPASARRLSEEDGLEAPAAEAPQEGPGLGGLARAVDALEDDETAAAGVGWHGGIIAQTRAQRFARRQRFGTSWRN